MKYYEVLGMNSPFGSSIGIGPPGVVVNAFAWTASRGPTRTSGWLSLRTVAGPWSPWSSADLNRTGCLSRFHSSVMTSAAEHAQPGVQG